MVHKKYIIKSAHVVTLCGVGVLIIFGVIAYRVVTTLTYKSPKTDTTPAASTPQPTMASTTRPMEIRGDENCKSTTLDALKLLSNSAPIHYATVTKYVGAIEV